MPRFMMSRPLVDAINLSPLTLRELSQVAQLPPSNISRYKTGTPFGKRTRLGLLRLAALLNVPADSAIGPCPDAEGFDGEPQIAVAKNEKAEVPSC